MCGSGTFLVEAALIARGIAPGYARPSWPFETWPDHDAKLFARLKQEAANTRTDWNGKLLGCDRHEVRGHG
jgi:putative N6-adenine-specific DNA methylase